MGALEENGTCNLESRPDCMCVRVCVVVGVLCGSVCARMRTQERVGVYMWEGRGRVEREVARDGGKGEGNPDKNCTRERPISDVHIQACQDLGATCPGRSRGRM